MQTKDRTNNDHEISIWGSLFDGRLYQKFASDTETLAMLLGK